MKFPAKVTLEITSEAYTWSLSDSKGKVLASHSMKRVDRGCFKGSGKTTLDKVLPEGDDWDELVSEIECCSPSSISDVLMENQ